MSKKITPEFYTKVPGGIWHSWKGGSFKVTKLATLRCKNRISTVPVAGVDVHSLRLADGSTWDCKNGWESYL